MCGLLGLGNMWLWWGENCFCGWMVLFKLFSMYWCLLFFLIFLMCCNCVDWLGWCCVCWWDVEGCFFYVGFLCCMWGCWVWCFCVGDFWKWFWVVVCWWFWDFGFLLDFVWLDWCWVGGWCVLIEDDVWRIWKGGVNN